MDKKLKKLPIDAETHKLLKYDPMYYVPNAPYDEYDFLKRIYKIKKER